MAAPKLPQQFGPYTLQELIARGGMAEIFRATMSGVGGFEKTVAIKKILPHLAENDEFITMLIDEARIIVSINHANIAQVYDLGKIDEDYYIAMEYIHGIDLSAIVKEFKDANRTVPVEHALFIASGIAAGLHVAHNKCDESGRPNNIVHRDVSPHNILISFAGDVKIIDFGVAKARGKEAHTQMGVIKGKLLYMAPEQAMAKELDGRADLFAMGLILYRMLTNHLPFEGDNEFQIYNHILSKEITSPRVYNPAIPEEVNQIVMMLLQRDPSKRYQDGYSAKVDLDRALQRVAPGYSISRLSRWVEADFSHLIAERQQKRSNSGRNDVPATPSHNNITGESPAKKDWGDWEDFDEDEDTVNVSMESPEALAMLERVRAERERKDDVYRPPPSAPWDVTGDKTAEQQVSSIPDWAKEAAQPHSSGHFAAPDASGHGASNPDPYRAPAGQSGHFGPPPSDQYGAPGQSGQFAQHPDTSGQYGAPPQDPYGSQQQPAPYGSGMYGAPNPADQHGAPNGSGIYGAPNQTGAYGGMGQLPPQPASQHYEPFQGPNPVGQPQAAKKSKKGALVPAIGILLLLFGIAAMLVWKLFVAAPAEPAPTPDEPDPGIVQPVEPANAVVEPAVVEVDAGPAPQEKARTVQMRVDTTPEGVSVFLGDKLIGEAPLDEPIPYGEEEVTLRFELEGYETKELSAIPYDSFRRKVEMTPLAAEEQEPQPEETVEEEKPKPKPKPKRRKRRKKTSKSTSKPAVPLLTDKKDEVPVF